MHRPFLVFRWVERVVLNTLSLKIIPRHSAATVNKCVGDNAFHFHPRLGRSLALPFKFSRHPKAKMMETKHPFFGLFVSMAFSPIYRVKAAIPDASFLVSSYGRETGNEAMNNPEASGSVPQSRDHSTRSFHIP